MNSQGCVHCGLCISSCPTYLVTGLETESPRGRIWLLDQHAAGTALGSQAIQHLDDCLDCRACEEVCPAHVPVGHLVNQFRQNTQYLPSHSLSKSLRHFLGSRSGRRQFRQLVAWSRYRVVQRTMSWFPNWIPPYTMELAAGLPGAKAYQSPKELSKNVHGPSVMLFTGCVMEAVYEATNHRAIDLLTLAGAQVVVPSAQKCCGALLAHSGELGGIRQWVVNNIEVFEHSQATTVAVTSGGCGAFLKEYPSMFSPADPYFVRAQRFSEAVHDISEVLLEMGLPSKPKNGQRISMHDACHLAHGQNIRQAPRKLLQDAGYELVEMPDADRCCGAGGTYNLTHVAMARTLQAYKVADVPSEVNAVALGNPGCQLQIAAGMKKHGRNIPVEHTVDLLWRAYWGETT